MNSRKRQRVTDSSPEPFRKQLAGAGATAGLNSLFPLTLTLWPGERILRSNTRIAPLNSVPGRARLSPARRFPWHSQLGALGTDAPYLKVHGKGRVVGKRLAHQEVLR